MFKIPSIIGALFLFLIVTCGPTFALGVVNSELSRNLAGDISTASFFARPFPYGYTGWGPCFRYVEVQTRWGLRLRRIRVCR